MLKQRETGENNQDHLARGFTKHRKVEGAQYFENNHRPGWLEKRKGEIPGGK